MPVKYIPRRLERVLTCTRLADFTCSDDGTLSAQGFLLPTVSREFDETPTAVHLDPMCVCLGFTAGPTMSLMSLRFISEREVERFDSLKDFGFLIAKMNTLKILSYQDLDLIQDAYIQVYCVIALRLAGWVVFDKPIGSPRENTGLSMPLWILPVITWSLLGHAEANTPGAVAFFRVLILQEQLHALIAEEAPCNDQPQSRRHRLQNSVSKLRRRVFRSVKSSKEDEPIQQAEKTEEKNKGLNSSHGTFRRVGIGFLSALHGTDIMNMANGCLKPVRIELKS
jgi:hypothetical protein